MLYGIVTTFYTPQTTYRFSSGNMLSEGGFCCFSYQQIHWERFSRLNFCCLKKIRRFATVIAMTSESALFLGTIDMCDALAKFLSFRCPIYGTSKEDKTTP